MRTSYLYFTDCEAPADAVLGEVDQAWMQLMAGLNVERLILAATMLGLGGGPSRTRSPTSRSAMFGKPIGAFQARFGTGSPTSRPSSRRRRG